MHTGPGLCPAPEKMRPIIAGDGLQEITGEKNSLNNMKVKILLEFLTLYKHILKLYPHTYTHTVQLHTYSVVMCAHLYLCVCMSPHRCTLPRVYTSCFHTAIGASRQRTLGSARCPCVWLRGPQGNTLPRVKPKFPSVPWNRAASGCMWYPVQEKTVEQRTGQAKRKPSPPIFASSNKGSLLPQA